MLNFVAIRKGISSTPGTSAPMNTTTFGNYVKHTSFVQVTTTNFFVKCMIGNNCEITNLPVVFSFVFAYYPHGFVFLSLDRLT